MSKLDYSSTWIVMPAYHAERTLIKTIDLIPEELRRNVVIVDDASLDSTFEIAQKLSCHSYQHVENLGYGGNQKTCYAKALENGAEVVIMLHPDLQYDPRVVGVMSTLIQLGNCDIVLGNRIRTRKEALAGGMPLWKYLLNRFSTFVEDLLLGQTIGDFHSGLRAYSREVLESVNFESCSNDFAFDQEFLVKAIALNFRIADIPVPARYDENSSSISFARSMKYALGGVSIVAKYLLFKLSRGRWFYLSFKAKK